MPGAEDAGQVNRPEKNVAHGHEQASAAWNELVSNRISWTHDFLARDFDVYVGFRDLADDFRARNPDRHFGARMILETLRFNTGVRAVLDGPKLNNNCASLCARLYLLERPDAHLEFRDSWLEHLSTGELAQIIDAFQAAGGVVDGETP
jgi:hypothetical protein